MGTLNENNQHLLILLEVIHLRTSYYMIIFRKHKFCKVERDENYIDKTSKINSKGIPNNMIRK
jgi:hypothetical protein